MTKKLDSLGLALYEDGPEDGPVLVLGHALGGTWRIWDQAVSSLVSKFRVIRWDLPGHGDSKTLEAPRTMGHVADLLVSALEQVGIVKFHVGGISFGGTASLSVAQKYPEKVLSLAMLDSGVSSGDSATWVQRAALVRQRGTEAIVDDTMERWFTEDFVNGPGRDIYEEIRTAYIGQDREGFAACCDVLAVTDLGSAPVTVKVPVLILSGEKDAGMTPKMVDELGDLFVNCTISKVIVPGLKHLTCVEAPLLVANAIADNAN